MALYTFTPNTVIESSKIDDNFAGLANGAEIQTGAITPGKWKNAYCFRAWDSGGTTLTDATAVQINLATEEYDYNSNFASSAYTAPVAGVYHFNGLISISSAVATGVTFFASVWVNGAETNGSRGPRYVPDNDGAAGVVTDLLLAAGDVVTLRGYQDSAGAEATVTQRFGTYLAGHLVHAI